MFRMFIRPDLHKRLWYHPLFYILYKKRTTRYYKNSNERRNKNDTINLPFNIKGVLVTKSFPDWADAFISTPLERSCLSLVAVLKGKGSQLTKLETVCLENGV